MTPPDMEFDDGPAPESFETATPVLPKAAPQSDSALPHSAEAEEHVIACCLLDGIAEEGWATLRAAKDAGLTPASFYFPAARLLFEYGLNALAAELPFTLDTLAEELKSNRMLDAVGGFAYLIQVTSKVPTTAHAQYFIRRVRDLAAMRSLREATARAQEQIKLGVDPEEIRAKLQRSIQPPDQRTTDLDSRRVKLQSPPPEPTTRLFLAGKPIATPGNLVTIISRAKTGKTATLGAAVAAIVAAHHDRHDMDTLKFTAPHTDEAVILFDTEQSPYDAWTCHSRSMARAGQSDDPAWLHHYAMVGMSAADLRASLPRAITKAKTAHKGIFTVILDGVADFVASVNDEAECNDFITWLRALAVDNNCPIICVIHSNEAQKSGDDGRGHLGKQLTRKAESNLLLKKVGEITTITSEKQRKAPITEKDGVAFRWDDTLQRHVTCSTESVSSGKMGGKPKTYTFDKFISIFPRSEDKAMTKQALLRYAADIAPIKETAFREILHEAVDKGNLERRQRSHGFVYFLNVPGQSHFPAAS